MKVNKSSFGLAQAGPLQLPDIAPNGGTATCVLPLSVNDPQMLSGAAPSNPLFLEVAVKCSLDVFFFNVGYDLSVVLASTGPVAQDAFGKTWQSVPNERKGRTQGQMATKVTPQAVIDRCKQYCLYFVVRREGPDSDLMYFSAKTANGLTVFCEIGLQRSAQGIQLVCCSDAPQLVPIAQAFVGELLRVRWQGGPGGG